MLDILITILFWGVIIVGSLFTIAYSVLFVLWLRCKILDIQIWWMIRKQSH